MRGYCLHLPMVPTGTSFSLQQEEKTINCVGARESTGRTRRRSTPFRRCGFLSTENMWTENELSCPPLVFVVRIPILSYAFWVESLVSVLRRVSLPLTQEGLVEIKHRYFYIHELQAFHQYGVLLEKRLFTFQLVRIWPFCYVDCVLYTKCLLVLLFQCVLLDLLLVHRVRFCDYATFCVP